jgi:hypothetical protein
MTVADLMMIVERKANIAQFLKDNRRQALAAASRSTMVPAGSTEAPH